MNNDGYLGAGSFANAYNCGDFRLAAQALARNVGRDLSPGARYYAQRVSRAGWSALRALNVSRNLLGLAEVYGPIDRDLLATLER